MGLGMVCETEELNREGSMNADILVGVHVPQAGGRSAQAFQASKRLDRKKRHNSKSNFYYVLNNQESTTEVYRPYQSSQVALNKCQAVISRGRHRRPAVVASAST